ncbi:MAG: GTPase Era [Clostridiales bacterium]|nr:GTPase Era [Clostridiales bacterium]
MKSGFVTLVGRPNVGKSSLINALVGEKVSIVSPKPQTTRDRIMGILNEPNLQMVFVDTPGIHKPKTKLGEYMNKCITSATQDVDVLVAVFDASRGVNEDDLTRLSSYLTLGSPVIVVLNKIDLVPQERVLELLGKFSPYIEQGVKEVLPCSCRKKLNLAALKKTLISYIPEGQQYFFDDEISDKPVSYMICEIIREKALLLLQDEIPHGLGVTMQSYKKEQNVTQIECDIICERDSHKQIIIGDSGSMIKKIGQSARRDIERLIDSRVYLKLFVKVRDDWRNNRNFIRDVGYSEN